ncbi:TonB-dependent receptor [Parabacteroides bouchesdurhonensis]|uniref:TonB-dependent receptor n=1 Tax=Parabacteroides bouchesdurhonensis TaxID=1936995 RepID=UPI000E4A1068|nr:TonB-dependent receptor [Parabacteroides bouchesdurhonensis]RHJ93072.1 TonB-dependent receptor [Bacteroides sp. AM07-16]
MKTIYNIKTLCVLAFLGVFATTVSAQEDNTAKDKNLNREMTLEREYDPSVQDASKVNTLPVVKEPEVRKIPIDYAMFTIPADPAKEIGLLPSGNIMTQMNYNKRRGYFNFGTGTYLNLNGDLGYHILSTDKDKLNIWFSHRSTNGKVKYIQTDEKVKAKLNENLGGIDFKHNFDKLSLLMGLKYGYSAFNYYGLPVDSKGGLPLPGSELNPPLDIETNQVNQTIRANIGVESKEDASVGYLLDIAYVNFSHKYALYKDIDGPTEHAFDAKFDLNARFGGNQKIGLGGNIEYFNYNLPSEYLYFENHAEGRVSPYYKVEGDNWNLKLGVNVMFVTGDDSKMMVSPDVAVDVEVADKTVLYAVAGGKLNSNSMYEISLINRYANPTQEVSPSRNWLDATLGIKSGVAPGFWFDVFAGYKITGEDVLFVPSRYAEMGGFYNYSESMSNIDTKRFFAGANLKYSYQQLVDFSLKGVYNHWTAKYGSGWDGVSGDLEHAWGKPEMELNAGVSLRPLNPLTVSLDYYLATGRYTELYGYDVVKMKNINELNLTGTYTFNDTFGVYAKLNNILCQKYEVLYGYPLQSFSAMVGVNINF